MDVFGREAGWGQGPRGPGGMITAGVGVQSAKGESDHSGGSIYCKAIFSFAYNNQMYWISPLKQQESVVAEYIYEFNFALCHSFPSVKTSLFLGKPVAFEEVAEG